MNLLSHNCLPLAYLKSHHQFDAQTVALYSGQTVLVQEESPNSANVRTSTQLLFTTTNKQHSMLQTQHPLDIHTPAWKEMPLTSPDSALLIFCAVVRGLRGIVVVAFML